MKRRALKNCIAATALLLSFCVIALSQGTTSRVTGSVHDANGAAVGGAMVTLTNEGTGISFTTETSDSGAYAFDLVQVGKYSVTIEKQGFKKFLSQGNSINVNLPTTISTVLETGGVAETVTVQAAGEQVQTSTSGNLGTTEKALRRQLWGSWRNPLDLNFQPGVVFTKYGGG